MPAAVPGIEVSPLLQQGLAFHQQGQLGAAGEVYREVVAAQPHFGPAWRLLGVIALQQGAAAEACSLLEQAIRLSPEVAEFHYDLALAHQAGGNLQAALLCCERALRMDATLINAWVVLSEVLEKLEQFEPALDCLKQALQLNPDHVQARFLLANAQTRAEELDAAAQNYRWVLQQDPDHVIAAVNLASILRIQGKLDESLRLLRQAQTRQPDSPLIAYNLGNALFDAGQLEETRSLYMAALPHHPRPAKVFYNLTSVMRFGPEDRTRLEEWEQIARTRIQTQQDVIHLEFALGKAHDDLKDYDQAFAHYRRGNALVPACFDPAAHRQLVTSTIEVSTAEFLQARSSWGSDSPAPLFIVGMPRSGTTLVEQIIARHPRVLSLGEREEMGQLVADAEEWTGHARNPARAAAAADQAVIQRMAGGYLESVNLSDQQLRFTDKMPTNFLLLGWIAICFPQARIIHTRRDPRDVCLSCYFQHFSPAVSFAFDLDHLVEYYSQYERLLAHWKTVLPGRILDIQYEELVEHPEELSRALIAHCGLDWDPACLKSHAVDSLVRTASRWQVRQPIYKSSRGRWRNYRKHIGPLLNAFGE